jgi:hypothetical protein
MATASRGSYRTRRFGNPLTRQAELQETCRYPPGARHHPQDEEPRDKSTVAGGGYACESPRIPQVWPLPTVATVGGLRRREPVLQNISGRLEEVELHIPSRQSGTNYTRPRVGPSSPINRGLRLGEQEGWGLFLEDRFLLF